MRFNRNIITGEDVQNFKDPTVLVPTLDKAPPAGVHPIIKDKHPDAEQDAATTAPGGQTVPSEDDYLTKLLKYIPAEILALYLFVDSVAKGNTDGTDRAVWLGATAIAAVILTIVYVKYTLSVERWLQVGMSALALGVYIFVIGGWFGTTTWYHSWYGSIAVAVFAVFAGMLRLKPLTTQGNPQQPAQQAGVPQAGQAQTVKTPAASAGSPPAGGGTAPVTTPAPAAVGTPASSQTSPNAPAGIPGQGNQAPDGASPSPTS